MHRRFSAALALAALVLFAGPAMAATLEIWWNKGYYPEEDQAMKEIVADWEKKTGNSANISFLTTEAGPKKVISALAARRPPDLAFNHQFDWQHTPRWAFAGDVLEDVSDVLLPIKDQFQPEALESVFLLNGKTGKRGYMAIPLQQQTAHIHYWKDILNDAGFTKDDIPRTWYAFWNFWCDTLQTASRKKKTFTHVYGVGQVLSTAATDTFFHLNMFLNAHGVEFIDKNGKLLVDDPKVRQGLIKTLKDYTSFYGRKCTPPGSVNWGDYDNNLMFLSKMTAMASNPTLSIPSSQIKTNPRNYEELIQTIEWPDGPGGRKMVYMVSIKQALVFKDSKNKALAKDFLRYLLKPKNIGRYIEGSLGRWQPTMPALFNTDFWTNPRNSHRYVAYKQYTTRKTKPFQQAYNWKYTKVVNERLWGRAIGQIVVFGKSTEDAVDELIARMKKLMK